MTRVGTRLSVREGQMAGHRESRPRIVDAISTIGEPTANRYVFEEDPQVTNSIGDRKRASYYCDGI